MPDKTVGILGGMGPEATIDLMKRILLITEKIGNVKDDTDHIRCIVDNNPKVPSRIKALIERNGESPIPCMTDMAKRLEIWGADFLCIACNTAHNYLPEVKKSVKIPVLDMIMMTAEEVSKKYPNAKVGLLASPAIRLTKIYEEPCKKFGLTPVYAEGEWEDRILKIIKDIKKGDTGINVINEFKNIAENLSGKGASVQVLACTELSIIGDSLNVPLIDAADVLANNVVSIAKGFISMPNA